MPSALSQSQSELSQQAMTALLQALISRDCRLKTRLTAAASLSSSSSSSSSSSPPVLQSDLSRNLSAVQQAKAALGLSERQFQHALQAVTPAGHRAACDNATSRAASPSGLSTSAGSASSLSSPLSSPSSSASLSCPPSAASRGAMLTRNGGKRRRSPLSPSRSLGTTYMTSDDFLSYFKRSRSLSEAVKGIVRDYPSYREVSIYARARRMQVKFDSKGRFYQPDAARTAHDKQGRKKLKTDRLHDREDGEQGREEAAAGTSEPDSDSGSDSQADGSSDEASLTSSSSDSSSSSSSARSSSPSRSSSPRSAFTRVGEQSAAAGSNDALIMLAQSVSVLEAGVARASSASATRPRMDESSRPQAIARLEPRGATSLRPLRQLLPSLPPRVPLPSPARAAALLCPKVRPSFSRAMPAQSLLTASAPLTARSGVMRSAAAAVSCSPAASAFFSPITPLLVYPSAMPPSAVTALPRRAAAEATAMTL